MTDDAQLAAQGRLLTEHANTKQRFVLLEVEIRRHAELFQHASRLVLGVLQEEMLLGASVPTDAGVTLSIATSDDISRLVSDYRATRTKLAHLRRQLRAFHVDL